MFQTLKTEIGREIILEEKAKLFCKGSSTFFINLQVILQRFLKDNKMNHKSWFLNISLKQRLWMFGAKLEDVPSD